MLRSIVLAHWEVRRIVRSRRALAAVALVPLAGAAVCALPWGPKDPALRCFFLAIAALFAWLLLYVRACSDRASGFAAGLESVPGAGTMAFTARFVTWLVLAAAQISIFYATMRAAG